MVGKQKSGTRAYNNPHARHKTHLHTMKVYKNGAIEGLLIKIRIFSTTEVFSY